MSYLCPKCNHPINISEEKLRALGYLTVCPQCLSSLKIIGNYAYIPTETVPLDETESAQSTDNDKRHEQFHPLHQQAVDFVASCNAISTPMLQARFGITSKEAAELMQDLERNGIVGPYNNGAPRKILIPHNKNLPGFGWFMAKDDTEENTQAPDGIDDSVPESEEKPNGKTYGCTINLTGCMFVIFLIMTIYLIIKYLS